MDALKTIGEAADATGLTEDTLRYYEKIGVVFDIERTASGHRRYTDGSIAWLGLVVRLRSTGMSLETIQRYAELAQQGASTIPQRRAILAAHKADVEREAQRLTELVELLNWKIAKYDDGDLPSFGGIDPCETQRIARSAIGQSSSSP